LTPWRALAFTMPIPTPKLNALSSAAISRFARRARPFSFWNKAAVVHDYLYSAGLVPRDMADAVLREASQATGVPAWRRWLMWAGVRLGGASHYTTAPGVEQPTWPTLAATAAASSLPAQCGATRLQPGERLRG
jgi:hypothetical protein